MPSGPRVGSSGRAAATAADDDDESEALILHRLDTDPRGRPIVHTIPSGAAVGIDEEQGRVGIKRGDAGRGYGRYSDDDGGDDDDDILAPGSRAGASGSSPLRLRPAATPALDKTGRPEWLEDGIRTARRSSRFRLLLCLALLIVVAAAFGIAFGPSEGVKQRVYKWAGDYWRAAPGADYPYPFPTDVGYPGPTETGRPADMADKDRLVATPTRGAAPIETRLPDAPKGFNPFEHMGPLSPYFSSDGFGVDDARYRRVPDGCQVEQVHLLHRHGARYPTTGSPVELIRDLVQKRDADATGGAVRFTGELAFLNTYRYTLGRELLTPVGREMLYKSGTNAVMQYGELVYGDIEDHARLLIRAGSQQRIVDSAISFMQGLLGSNWHNQTDLEVQIEAPGFNTTLAPNFACPNSDKPEAEPGRQWSARWQQIYTKPIIERLQPHAEGVELTPKLINAMQQLCAYDTVAVGFSPFCRLFSRDEWLALEYAWDLVFYGSYGSGSPVGRAQGVGWVNEFMARLQRKPWDASTQTSENATLASHNVTFPVDRSFYADFTHDSTIAGVVAALGLEEFAQSLPADGPPPTSRKMRTSIVVPFAARLVVEVLACGEGPVGTTSTTSAAAGAWGMGGGVAMRAMPTPAPGVARRGLRGSAVVAPDERRRRAASQGTDASSRYVRLLLNDAVVPLDRQLPRGCPGRPDGLCHLDGFVAALADRNERAAWGNCTAERL